MLREELPDRGGHRFDLLPGQPREDRQREHLLLDPLGHREIAGRVAEAGEDRLLVQRLRVVAPSTARRAPAGARAARRAGRSGC